MAFFYYLPILPRLRTSASSMATGFRGFLWDSEDDTWGHMAITHYPPGRPYDRTTVDAGGPQAIVGNVNAPAESKRSPPCPMERASSVVSRSSRRRRF